MLGQVLVRIVKLYWRDLEMQGFWAFAFAGGFYWFVCIAGVSKGMGGERIEVDLAVSVGLVVT